MSKSFTSNLKQIVQRVISGYKKPVAKNASVATESSQRFDENVTLLKTIFDPEVLLNEPAFSNDDVITFDLDEPYTTHPSTEDRTIRTQLLGKEGQRQRVILQDSQDPCIVIGHYQKDENGLYIFTPATTKPLPSLYHQNTLDVFNNAIKDGDKLLGNKTLEPAHFDNDSVSSDANDNMRQLLLFANRDKARRKPHRKQALV